MKKLILTIAMMVSAIFAASAAKEPVTDEFKVVEIIETNYPHLSEYFAEGVIEIASITEETLFDGSTQYDIRYRFVNSYYGNDELESLLRNEHPVLYRMKKAGLVSDVSAFKFVDRETGEIRTKLSFNRRRVPMVRGRR